ncbi:MAG TPA: phenylalanine--tRNA ligase subunit beta [Mycobacteriales bacterium]|nr:phenylalanine--tRNA ligase subunit beta [Mycobacteriales bacterium]
MRVPLSWLRTLVPDLDAGAAEIAAALIRVGLEVEQVLRFGHDVSGVVVGQVLDVEELTGLKKPIRACRVDIGSRVHDVVCGATNFAAGDLVAFAQPGAQLPGGIAIATRQAYGRTSDGMICSAAELEAGADASGIVVLPAETPLGADVVDLLLLRDEVLDIAVTPDRGYALSMRGVAREVATALGLSFRDPAALPGESATATAHPVRVDDPSGCDRYVARIVTDFDPAATSPLWLQRRLTLAGMRPVSLAVDVTNHVMLELGQPLHAFDLALLRGGIAVRRAVAGETLTTLDGSERALVETDLVIADDEGPVALAGVMGGARTEVSANTTALLLESAHFESGSVARTARRLRLSSEASKRFERGVDAALGPAAAAAATDLLVQLGGARPGGVTDVDARPAPVRLRFPLAAPERVAGRPYEPATVRGRLLDVGCTLSESDPNPDVLLVEPPSWRPDLTGTAELVEEVLRLEGLDTIPVVLPSAPAGRGLTPAQRGRAAATRALAAAGLVEVVLPPFVSPAAVETLGLSMPPVRLLNPLSDVEALLRPSLLPGLLAAAGRNVGRGLPDVWLFETGLVFHGKPGAPVAAAPGVSARPTDDELAALDASLPAQPHHLAFVLAGPSGDWAVAVETAVAVGTSLGLTLEVTRATEPGWHPGRCARLSAGGDEVGVAGEAHPSAVEALGLPPRTAAAELSLDRLLLAAAAAGPTVAPVVSSFPPATVDVALVVAAEVPAAAVATALRRGAGPLLEDLRLFDVYTGPQVEAGSKSLAYALRLRASDRTLTDTEVLAARDAAIAEAHRATGASLRTA